MSAFSWGVGVGAGCIAWVYIDVYDHRLCCTVLAGYIVTCFITVFYASRNTVFYNTTQHTPADTDKFTYMCVHAYMQTCTIHIHMADTQYIHTHTHTPTHTHTHTHTLTHSLTHTTDIYTHNTYMHAHTCDTHTHTHVIHTHTHTHTPTHIFFYFFYNLCKLFW